MSQSNRSLWSDNQVMYKILLIWVLLTANKRLDFNAKGFYYFITLINIYRLINFLLQLVLMGFIYKLIYLNNITKLNVTKAKKYFCIKSRNLNLYKTRETYTNIVLLLRFLSSWCFQCDKCSRFRHYRKLVHYVA